jgi:hypothetical protein
MRDFTKSMLNYSWAMSVFGARQLVGLLGATGSGGAKNVTDSFQRVTNVALETLDDSTRAVYRAGESLQNAAVDIMLGGVMLGPMNPTGWAKTGVDVMQRAAQSAGKTMRQAANAVRNTAGNMGGPSPFDCAGGEQPPPTSDPPRGGGWGAMPE